MSKKDTASSDVLDTLKSMFPSLSNEILTDIYTNCGKNFDTTIDFLLQEVIPPEPVKKLKTEDKMGHSGSKSKPVAEVKVLETTASPKPMDESKTETKAKDPKSKELKASTEEIKSSLTYSQESYYDDEEDGDALRDSGMWDDEVFSGDGKLVPMNPEINPNLIDKEVAFLPPVEEQLALVCLNKVQADAVKYVVDRSKIESETQYPNVLAKVKRLGFKEEDLKRTLKYIRDEAPIIVHINLDRVIEFIIKDTHYRNQFETNISGGTLSSTSRIDWENRLFNKIYGQITTNGFERVKYGVLNIVSDPMGVRCCSGYGDSYMVLKKVRLRTTFASKDTSAADVKLASCEYYCHVMNEWNDKEI